MLYFVPLIFFCIAFVFSMLGLEGGLREGISILSREVVMYGEIRI